MSDREPCVVCIVPTTLRTWNGKTWVPVCGACKVQHESKGKGLDDG